MTLPIEKDISLAEHTTLQVGGVADYFVRVKTVAELTAALLFARSQTAARPFILGGGSNVLVSDTGYRGLVIKNEILGREYDARDDEVVARIGAGESLDAVVADAVEQGYWGLENLSAIPGTIGATPVQNVGAYGVEVANLITTVTAVHIDTGVVREFSHEDCQFAYRDSFFKTDVGREWIIVSVTFSLSLVAQPRLEYGDLSLLAEESRLTPALVRERVIQIREGKFPDWRTVGTAGSFFKNPIIVNEHFAALQERFPELPGYPAGATHTKASLGWILDHVCGLRGFTKDGVELYEHQALVLVNRCARSAATIDRFADEVAAIVARETGIIIEREVRSV